MITLEEVDNALNYLFKTNAHLSKKEHEIMNHLNDGLYSGDCNGTIKSACEYLEARGYKVEKIL